MKREEKRANASLHLLQGLQVIGADEAVEVYCVTKKRTMQSVRN